MNSLRPAGKTDLTPMLNTSRCSCSTRRLYHIKSSLPLSLRNGANLPSLPLPRTMLSSRPKVSRTVTTSKDNSRTLRFAKIPHRSILCVEGRDTFKLLQGLVTNNVRHLEEMGKNVSEAFYCAFLNPQGRMISTAFLYALGLEKVLVDTDAKTFASLLSFIKRFKLRSKVTLNDASDEFEVWALWGQGVEEAMAEMGNQEGVEIVQKDDRGPSMGSRIVIRKGGHVPELLSSSSSEEVATGSAYTIHRIIQGVADGSEEVWENQSLPLEIGCDYMGGVDFRKGCYVGQELTARTHHTGVVRKRVVPVSLYRPEQEEPPREIAFDESFDSALQPQIGTDVRSVPAPSTTTSSTEKKPSRGRSAGKYLSGVGNVGLALLRLEQVARWTEQGFAEGRQGDDGLMMRVKAGETELGVRPWIPDWWPKEESEGRGKPAVGLQGGDEVD